MYDAGIALIMERKYYTIDGVKNVYYECVDAAYGCVYDFNNSGKNFCCLSGICENEFITNRVDSNKQYEYCSFKTLSDLAKLNGNTTSLKKFMNEYRRDIGKCYIFDGDHTFETITDKKILAAIGKECIEFDDRKSMDEKNILKIYKEVKETIISQDEQVMQILTSLFKNQKLASSSLSNEVIAKLRENVFVYGGKGTGKTEILKKIGKACGVPVAFEEATSLSVDGYNGRSIKDILKDLYLSSGKNIELAQRGILVIDGFDKLCDNRCESRVNISNISVQRELVNLLEGLTCHIDDVAFNTSKLSVVAIGEFSNLMAFSNYRDIISSSTKNYGIIPELIGNFSNFVKMNTLFRKDLFNILVNSNLSPLNTYKQLFESMNIEFTYNEGFLDYVANQTLYMNIGARGLKIVFDEIMNEALFEILTGECLSINLTRPLKDLKAYSLTRKRDNR